MEKQLYYINELVEKDNNKVILYTDNMLLILFFKKVYDNFRYKSFETVFENTYV